MKTLLLIVIAMLAGGYVAKHYGCNDNVASNYDQVISIADLKDNCSLYSDSLVTLQGVVIEETNNLLNYTKATITDFTGETLQFITNQSYEKGESVDVTGRLHLLSKKDNNPNLIFVDEHLRPINDLFRLISGLHNSHRNE